MPRRAAIFGPPSRSDRSVPRSARSGATSAKPLVPVRKYSPPGTSPVSNDRPVGLRADVRQVAVGREHLALDGAAPARPRSVAQWSVPCSVSWPFSAWAPLVLQAVNTQPGSHGKKPSSLAAKLRRHRLDDAVVVVGEGAAVLPHERERAGLVEAGRAGGRLVDVDLLGQVGRQHDVVAHDRVGVGVEVPDQVERAPVAPHPQVGRSCRSGWPWPARSAAVRWARRSRRTAPSA